MQAQLREFYDENLKLKEALESNRRAIDRVHQEYRECQEKVLLEMYHSVIIVLQLKRYKQRCSLCEEDLRRSQHILDKKEARIGELQKQLNEAQTVGMELKKELDAMKTKCLIAEKQAKYAEEELKRRATTTATRTTSK